MTNREKIMKKIRHFFHIYNLDEVFTPNTSADVTYVRRLNLERTLENYLSQRGRCIIVYGESGSGKTTLMRRRLKELKINFVSISCTHETTYDTILRRTIDELDIFYIAKKSTNNTYSISASVSEEYLSIKQALNVTSVSSQNVEQCRAVPLQVTAQRLAKFLGEVKSILILEDFHKVADQEKTKIADLIKVFIDEANNYPDLKVVCIGAVESPRELLKMGADLYNRVSEIEIPMMEDWVLDLLIRIGTEALHVKMSDDLINKIVYYSNNIASLAHQMSRDICFLNNIKKTGLVKRTFDDEMFIKAVQSFIDSNSDSLKCIYDLCTKQKIGWYVLRTMIGFSKPVSFNEIVDRLNKTHHNYNINNIQETLDGIASEEMNILRYSPVTEKYSISTPFWRAFLNMQMSKERADKEKLNRAKNDPRLRLKNLQNPGSEVELAFLKFMDEQSENKDKQIYPANG